MPSRAIRVACLAAVLQTVCLSSAHAAPLRVTRSPKLVNPYLDWQLLDANLPQLAKWDVVILDADQQERSAAQILKLRQLNPSIKILAYVPSEEIADARFNESSNYPFGKLAQQIQNSWYVHDANGNKDFFWQGSSLLNVTDEGPTDPSGRRWNDELPDFIHQDVLSSGLWDGIFLDNSFDAISYYAKSPVDLDRDGKADAKATENAAWRQGMTKILSRIHANDPSAILVGNGGFFYAKQLDGAFFEGFPSYDWAINWKEFRQATSQSRQPTYSAINANTSNRGAQTDYQAMRYGLASALEGGGLYSFDNGDENHNTLWWYDEYDVPLGAPRAAPRALVGGSGVGISTAVWARDFQNGIAVLNSTNATKRVALPGVFEKIRGTQDPSVNDGTIVTSIDLAAHDGLLLLRRSEPQQIIGSAYENGVFVRMYNALGQPVQNGFFAQRTDVPSGALILSTDLEGDGQTDVLSASKGILRIQLGKGTTTLLSPFGKTFIGSLGLATGQLTRTGSQQIVVAQDASGAPLVKIFSLDGTLVRQWNAYQPSFHGGVRVAIGNLAGDGLHQIVTGAGPGGGPLVRLWKTDGTAWGGSFYAFDQSEHGGISVAAGDIDGDGKDEIVVGSGQGSIPRVRIFDARGTLKREIVLGKTPLAGGLRVTVSDVNSDGSKEILVSGLPLF